MPTAKKSSTKRPVKKTTSKKSARKQKSFKETLWDTANGPPTSKSTNNKGEGKIRQELVENDLADESPLAQLSPAA